MRKLAAIFKIIVFLIASLFIFVFQRTLLTFTKGRIVLIGPRLYHKFLCYLFGLKVVVEGQIETGSHVVYAGNHLSYLDIEALGSILVGSFIAKKDIERWPIFGALGKLQRTIYISRDPKDAPKQVQVMEQRLTEGLPLIVFPEGTSSNGLSVFPFKSSFFEIFLNKNIKIQPFTISLVSVDGAPVNATSRDTYAWYGDMNFEPHFWAFAQTRGAVVKIIFQEPIATLSYTDRKTLSHDVYQAVCRGLDLSRPVQ